MALRLGLAVFPLPPGGRRPEPGWQHRCTRDPRVVASWPAGANIGVGCRASRVVVLDLDRHPGKPDGVVGSTSGARSPLGPGIDTRGPGRRSGGYVVGPGSVVGGRAYAVERDVPMAPLPEWLVDVLALTHASPPGQVLDTPVLGARRARRTRWRHNRDRQ